MKTLSFLLLLAGTSFILAIEQNHFLSKIDAQKILGQPVVLKESAMQVVKGVEQYKSSYTGMNADTLPGRSVNVHCLYEVYPDEAAAKHAYAIMESSNRTLPGFEYLKEANTDGFFHADGFNFQLVIIRHANHLICMKVNKVPFNISITDLKHVSQKMADAS